MLSLKRSWDNPILKPNKNNLWEEEAVFNGCVVKDKKTYHMVYRAISLNLSTVGYAKSQDGVKFFNRYQLIRPEEIWEKFGCEDPRITKLDGKYYIFYTALSSYPFEPEGIKIGLAISSDLKKIEEKHPITTFNSKAMALFPKRINGKIMAVLTADTDRPPAKICIASGNQISDFYSPDFWNKWYQHIDIQTIPLLRNQNDHIEVGAPPVATEYGWLLIYSYIKNYFSPNRVFGIEAVLLDFANPQRIIGRTKSPLLTPDEDYELYGKVPKVVFPSGAVIQNNRLYVYYGAADTTCCLADCSLEDLLSEILKETDLQVFSIPPLKLERYQGNPIIKPNPQNPWEAKYTFNPAALQLNDKIYIIYRAMGIDETSVFGLAASSDGFTIEERLKEPIYVPREDFEKKKQAGFSGCEDPRITRINKTIYMSYTSFDGKNATRVALTSIAVEDFLQRKWNWKRPVLISPPGVDDKNAGILSDKINGRYVILHRIAPCIWIDTVSSLEFDGEIWLKGDILMVPREDKWDSLKIGIAGPPIKTKDGWLLIYHGLSKRDNIYRLGVALLDLNNPYQIKARLDHPILEPETSYEHGGFRPGTVFSCGAVVKDNQLLVYYGAGDHVIGVAYTNLDKFLEGIKSSIT